MRAGLLLLLLAAPPADERVNVVFILADDLGWTDLGVQGTTYYETPNIDRMAAQGMRFTQGYSCGPNCQPTRAALLSGQYGPRTGIYTVGSVDRFDWRSRPLRPVDNVVKLDPAKTTLAEALKAAGYATALFGKWHLGEDPEHHPAAQGFDEAVVSSGRHVDFKTIPPARVPDGAYLADWLTDKAVDFIRRRKDGPFFLYLPHFGVHSPFQAKPELIKKFQAKAGAGGHDNAVYAAMIASVDESVGRIAAVLDELGLSGRTLLIFSSDNGGLGGYARDGIRGQDVTDNAPLRGGKGMLYEGGLRVPWIFRSPGRVPAGVVNETPITSVDLYPTLLELAGAPAPPGCLLDGTSFAGALAGAPAGDRPPLFWHFPGYLGAGQKTWRTTPVGAIRDGDWKLLEFFEDGRRELYHLKDDPGERTNLAAERKEAADALHARLAAWRKAVGAPMPTANKP